jgi:hypothetical protein
MLPAAAAAAARAATQDQPAAVPLRPAHLSFMYRSCICSHRSELSSVSPALYCSSGAGAPAQGRVCVWVCEGGGVGGAASVEGQPAQQPVPVVAMLQQVSV